NRLAITDRGSDGLIGDYLAHLHGSPEAMTNAREDRSLDDILEATLVTDTGYHTAGIDWRFARESFEPDGAPPSVPQRRDVAEGFFASDGSGWTLKEAARQSIGLSGSTRFLARRHEIAGGASLRRRQVAIRGRLTGNVLIDNYTTGTIRRFLTLNGAPVDERDDEMIHRDAALYLQDHAQFGSRLTVNAGVRWERLDARGPDLGFVTRALVPRVGMLYDLSRDGRTRLSASYSAYNDEVSDFELAGLLTTYGIAAARAGEPAGIFAPATFIIPDLKPRSSDEMTLGLGYHGGKYRVTTRAGWRRLRNDVVRTRCGDAVCITNPADRQREQQTLQLDFGNAGWLNFSYVHSHVHGNTEQRIFPQTHFTVDPYLDVGRAFGGLGDSGPLHTDRTHSMTLAGSIRFLGANLNYPAYWKSGSPISRYGVSDFLGSYPFILGRRGEVGRTPSIFEVSLSADYELLLFERVSTRLTLIVQNVLDAQRAIAVDERWTFHEADNGSLLAGNPRFGQPILRTPPRTILFGLRIGCCVDYLPIRR
ncbi:MAG TPA: TonB-dependent receptor, partial [Thermoanaerobaculia bacterium]|nr:TonB-dependent receptor [Thermoanaerobaculia bacterium]